MAPCQERLRMDISITVAGVERVHRLPPITENLEKTFQIYKGIKTGTMHIGEVLYDTSFDLMSARTETEEVRCIGVPAAKNDSCWIFLDLSSSLGRADTLKIDRRGATVCESMFPFVARKMTGEKSTGAADISSIIEVLAVPADRPARSGESIALVLDSSLAPDSSVAQYYRRQGNAWILHGIPDQCPEGSPGSESREDATAFTLPTTTMQSEPSQDRAACRFSCQGHGRPVRFDTGVFRLGFRSPRKTNHPHLFERTRNPRIGLWRLRGAPVLLGALLRAVKIPAHVVLGLVV